uniref:ANK_REP_REGION domain-containing protein n=1 Tax=Ditylum brightwellii TaxID=49249 RepID=A0A7S4W490_9STRA|mmetsp:Transcript_64581/g.95549  ORF Transcript_64581/g.95549 Transcript_64581/m.95549 type:complete len:450 (+) Transcript_64581:61-1410(+)
MLHKDGDDNTSDTMLQRSSESKDDLELTMKQFSTTRTDSSHDESIVNSITQVLGSTLQNISNANDMLKLGMGLGISLGAQGLLKGYNSKVEASSQIIISDLSEREESTSASNVWKSKPKKLSSNGFENELICHEHRGKTDESTRKLDPNEQDCVGLDRNVETVLVSSSEFSTSSDKVNVMVMSSACANKEVDTILPKKQHETHHGAGLGTTYLSQDDEGTQNKVLGQSGIELQKLSDIIPVGFLSAISLKRVGKQYVEYLPFVPNLPQCKPIGRVKPRTAENDWLAVGFDPWSAGKDPLSVEFIPSLSTHADSLKTTMEREPNCDAFINLEDKAGLEVYEDQVSKERMMAQAFAELCSLIRHNKYRELEDIMNQPDWSLPIEYADDSGNTLLMISCQNGNKRIAKLCLRRGGEINKQNMNGQTCLHYAFGYGFGKLMTFYALLYTISEI